MGLALCENRMDPLPSAHGSLSQHLDSVLDVHAAPPHAAASRPAFTQPRHVPACSIA